MENFFSRLTLDIIGKAVFNYDFDSLTHDDPVIQVHICTAACVSSASMCNTGRHLQPCLTLAHIAALPHQVQVNTGSFTVSSNTWACNGSLAISVVLLLMTPDVFTVCKEGGTLLDSMA